jgi:DNA-binding GntR family transcriptional regulator
MTPRGDHGNLIATNLFWDIKMLTFEYQRKHGPVNTDSPSPAQNAAGEIADRLRRMILTGDIEPGARLTQRELAAGFGLSVMPVRDAIKRLLGEGLIVQEGQKTIVVAPLRADDFIDIMEMRALLEPAAMKLSCPRLTAADIAESWAMLKQARTDEEPFEFVAKHWAFHRSLYKRAGRPRLLASIEAQHLHLNRYLMPNWARIGVGTHWAEGERELLEHVAQRHWAEAEEFLRADLERTMLRVLHALPSQS